MLVVVMVVTVISAVSTQAQVTIGGHVGYASGGDLSESAIAYGAQVILPVTDIISFLVSGSMFDDEADTITVGITHIAGEMRASVLVFGEKLKLSGGIGVSHNAYDVDVSLPGYEVTIENAFGFLVSGGVSFLITKNVEVFIEHRCNWIDSESEIQGPYDCQTVDGPYNSALTMLGVGIAL